MALRSRARARCDQHMTDAIPPFRYRQDRVAVVFGAGASDQLADHLDELNPQRLLVVHGSTGAEVANQLRGTFGTERTAMFDDIAGHVPVERAERAVAMARTFTADTVVAIGGGSAIGFAKIVARETGAQIAAVPTTYSGSEMTPVWGVTAAGRKSTDRDAAVMPRLVVYDPLLTLSLPARASAASGMNAMAHAVDALYASDAGPLVATIAVQALSVLAEALPALAVRRDDVAARTQACYGAHLAGLVLGSTGMALHHRMCHVLGGRYALPHAETHAVLLPHSVAFNETAAATANARIAAAARGTVAATAIWDLERRLDLPASLAELGLHAGDIAAAAAEVAATPVSNPAPVSEQAVAQLLEDALHGRPPQG